MTIRQQKAGLHSVTTIKESPNPFLRKMGLRGQISQPIRGQQLPDSLPDLIFV